MKTVSRREMLTMLATAILLAGAGATSAADGRGIVYLVRGGFDIFSTGMDKIAGDLADRGIDAHTLGQAGWREAAAEAAERYRVRKQPIVLIGHSFGANAAILMAGALGRERIPVALVVLFDPTEALKAPANTARVINFLSADVVGNAMDVTPGAGFKGTIENVNNPDVIHIQIDDKVELQERTVAEVAGAVGVSVRVSGR